MHLRSLLEPFVSRLERLGIPYMITGSMAGIAYGEPRMTHDVDFVISLPVREVRAFAAAFPLDEFYCPPDEVLATEIKRANRGHANLIHHATGFKADIYFAFDDLHRWALARRQTVEIDGVTARVAPIEYVIVRKLEYYREGKSEKHLRDIRSMLDVSSDVVDRDAIAGFVAERGLAAEWALVAG